MVSRTLAAVAPDDDDDDENATLQNGKTVPSLSGGEDTEPPTTPTPSTKDTKKLSVEECLYLATRGGAHCLGLGNRIGGFEIGMEFDAQLIQLSSAASPPPSPSLSPSTQQPAQSNPNPTPPPTNSNSLSSAFTSLSETPADAALPSLPDLQRANSQNIGDDDDGDAGLVELWGGETWAEKVAKWVFCGDDRNTRKVFVRGRLVHERR